MSSRSKFEEVVRILSSSGKMAEAFSEDKIDRISFNDWSEESDTSLGKFSSLMDEKKFDNDEEALLEILKVSGTPEFDGLQIAVDPFGVTLIETPELRGPPERTGTGTNRCTFDPWDGCGGDFDG